MQTILLDPPLAGRSESDDEFVEFWPAGTQAHGEFRCVACGQPVITFRALPSCPQCTGRLWERDSWSPFSRMPSAPDRAGDATSLPATSGV